MNTWKKNIRFFVVLLICILAGAEVDIFVPSFPELQKTFSLSPAMVQLTVSVNFLAYCICSLFAGSMGDRFNRRTVMLVSLAIFVFGSAACVFATDYFTLVFGRLLQGVGMAGPAVLGMLLVLDDCAPEKRAGTMGIFNGLVTLSMAFAPVLGSYINLHFGWRGNFWVLFLLSACSLIGGYFTILDKKGDPSVVLSPMAYKPLIRSRELMICILGMSFLSMTYWLFIAMAPILYMDNLGVPLSQFGFYQGAMCGVFSVVSLFSPSILAIWGQRKMLNLGILLCAMGGALFLILSLFVPDNPLYITGAMLLFSIGAVFPCNIIYPISLEILPKSSGRSAALMNSIRLLLTAGAVQGVGIFYDGSFFPIGITQFCSMFIGVFLIAWTMRIVKIQDAQDTVSALESPNIHAAL
jgi:DHA1 family bicyclomycin/chloramphenicol resistance-like MFS transporter